MNQRKDICGTMILIFFEPTPARNRKRHSKRGVVIVSQSLGEKTRVLIRAGHKDGPENTTGPHQYASRNQPRAGGNI